MAERQHLDRDADLDAARPRGDGRGDGERRREDRPLGREMQLGEPQRVEAPGLGRVHLRPRLVEALGMRALPQRRKLVEHAEFHGAHGAGNAPPPQWRR